ncbi:MAG: hypothetical protein LBE22_09580 [Azoarcus sp.]|nr:hypothetical protein [Azoarcus sp.]
MHDLNFVELSFLAALNGPAAIVWIGSIGVLIIQFLIWKATKIGGFGWICFLTVAPMFGNSLLSFIPPESLPDYFLPIAFTVLIAVINIALPFVWWSIYKKLKNHSIQPDTSHMFP